MAEEIELSHLDLRYESYRMKASKLEKRLLAAIAEQGIEEPLEGVDAGESHILLNGFKRFRCAKKLKINLVPYNSLGQDEVIGILSLLRNSNKKSLSILEQAAFVDELANIRNMSVAEIAAELSKSKAWVSVRIGLIATLTPKLRSNLFSGAFPTYSYIYTLLPFMRINGERVEEIEQFVGAVSGNNLSVREIEHLAHGYFRGPESFRNEILSGNLALPLEQLNQAAQNSNDCSEFERLLLKDLERIHTNMQRVIAKSKDQRIESRTFYAQCHLIGTSLLSIFPSFTHRLKELHDRSAKA